MDNELIDSIKKLNIRDGDLLIFPENTTLEDMKQVVEVIRYLNPTAKAALVAGDIKKISETDMNNAGWYRK